MKRFTETEKWRDKWFRGLEPKFKCLWSYLTDNCDHAGVIEPDWELVTFQIGAKVSSGDLVHFSGRVVMLENGKLLLPGFIKFQYGTLSHECKPHAPVFAALAKHGLDLDKINAQGGLSKAIEGYQVGFDTLLYNIKEKEKEEDKTAIPPKPEWVTEYSAEIGHPMDGQAWCDSYAQKGWAIGKGKMKDWRAAVRNWKAQGWTPKPQARAVQDRNLLEIQ